jgi:hypothetical protein
MFLTFGLLLNIYFLLIRLRIENMEAAAKGIQSKAEADPFSR